MKRNVEREEVVVQKILDIMGDCFSDSYPGGSEWRRYWDEQDEMWRIDAAPALCIGPDGTEGFNPGIFEARDLIEAFEMNNELTVNWNTEESCLYIAGNPKNAPPEMYVEIQIYDEPFGDADPAFHVHGDGTVTHLKEGTSCGD